MHLGENLNGSVFTQPVVSQAIPTLSNTPIMGLINPETKDFEGHEMALIEDEEGELSFKNVTVPYGVIPEFNNAQFEDRVGDDGVTRTYLTVEGLLWNKWEDAIDVIESKYGMTGQSMEITDFDGNYTNDDLFEFTEFKFYGACLLGDATQPAMKNSTVEVAFSHKTSENIIQEKLAEFAKSIEEGGNNLDKVTQEELEQENTFNEEGNTEEPTVEEPKPEEVVEDNPEEPVDDPAVEPETEEPTEPEEGTEEPPVEPTPEPEEPNESEEPESPEEEDKVVKEDNITEARAAVSEHDSQIEPAINRIVIGDKTYSVEEATTLIEAHFALLQELHEAEINELFAQHADELTDEELSTLKAAAYSKTKEEVETSIFAIIGRKSFANKQENKAPTSFSAIKINKVSTVSEPYGGILNKFKK